MIDLDWQPSVAADGIVSGLSDIDQCIRTILSTPKGSDPHRPDFACDLQQYLDWPQDRAVPYLVMDVREAILRYEPRVSDVRITAQQGIGQITLSIEWLPAAGNWQRSVAVLGGA